MQRGGRGAAGSGEREADVDCVEDLTELVAVLGHGAPPLKVLEQRPRARLLLLHRLRDAELQAPCAPPGAQHIAAALPRLLIVT